MAHIHSRRAKCTLFFYVASYIGYNQTELSQEIFACVTVSLKIVFYCAKCIELLPLPVVILHPSSARVIALLLLLWLVRNSLQGKTNRMGPKTTLKKSTQW